MSHIVGPESSSNFGRSHFGRQPFFVTKIVREFGFRGVVALLLGALVAFVPLALLVWWNVGRLTSVVAAQCGQHVIVKPERFEHDKEQDEPGETALLQITCDVPAIDGQRELLRYDDPSRRSAQVFDSYYVRNECVYLRKKSDFNFPYALLGKPPVSVWLPAGDYEVAVVHDAPRSESRMNAPSFGFPLVTVFDSCTLPAKQKTVRRIFLPHYDWGNSSPILPAGQTSGEHRPTDFEFQPIINAVPGLKAIPTPGGYVLALPEPKIHHSEDHRQCIGDFTDLHAIPREWTRDQIAGLRNWLPKTALAQSKLSELVSALLWREFFAGWFCYIAAGITGLVFTKWGALFILEPHRRRESLAKSAKLLTKIFFLSVAAWFLFKILTN